MFDAVIFDHDGTLVDSEPVHLRIWQELIEPHRITHGDYTKYLVGTPSIDTARWLVSRFELPIKPDELLESKIVRLNEALADTAFPLMPGVPELLTDLSQRSTKMGLASGAREPEVMRSLKYHNLGQYFYTVATSDRVANNKPAPDVYLLAASELSVDPKRCVAVEDSDPGQQAAVAAGMQCIRLNTISNLPTDTACTYLDNLIEVGQWLSDRL